MKNDYFLLGIKGVGMASLAIILKKMGYSVWGVDVSEKFITDKTLMENNIIVYSIKDAKNKLTKNTICIYSAAHDGYNNELIQKAVQIGCTVYHQAQFVQKISTFFKKSIAVSGSHGKTTTTSLISHIFKTLSDSVGYLFGSADGGFFSGKDVFIYEADEYGADPPRNKTPKILFYFPDYVVLTNIDYDHPDVYKDKEDVKNAYKQWITNILREKPHAQFVVNGDDALIQEITQTIPKNQIYTVGWSKENTHVINDSTIILPNGKKYSIKTQLLGKHNILNCVLVFVLLSCVFAYPYKQVLDLILSFKGAKRRLELVFNSEKFMLFDDYAHHPTEIAATIKGLKKRYPKKKIHLVFQPHTFSRTKALYKEFIKSFIFSDFIYILPIYPSAREKFCIHDVSSRKLHKDMLVNKKNSFYANSYLSLRKYLIKNLSLGDIVITMGAGNVNKFHDKLINLLKNYVEY